jgi:hypothetical protein
VDAWRRYAPPRHDTSVTGDTTDTGPSSPVTDVSDVSLVPATHADGSNATISTEPGAHTCRQCNAAPDGSEQEHTIDDERVWLHAECERFWRNGDGWGRR